MSKTDKLSELYKLKKKSAQLEFKEDEFRLHVEKKVAASCSSPLACFSIT